MVITLWDLPYTYGARHVIGEPKMTQYIVMKKNTADQWVLFKHSTYRTLGAAQKVIDEHIDLMVLRALDNAVRMHSAVRGVNREKYLKMRADTINARKGFKIVSMTEVF